MATPWTWDKARFAVERECTCKGGQRSAECIGGWHRVDGFDTATAAHDDAAACSARWGFRYRAVDSHEPVRS